LSIFDFELQDRLQCQGCNGVNYIKTKTNQLNLILLPEEGKIIEQVELSNCFERYFATGHYEIDCSICGGK